MLMEERMMLMARGTASGYSGALSAPTFTLASPVASGSQTALAAATYYVNVTADAGVSGNGFGESILGTEASTAVASGDVLTVTVSTAVAGALGYNIYVGTATGAANLKYQGTLRGTGTFTIQGAGASGLTGNNAAFTTSGAAASRAAADTSAYATGYDGILPTVLGANSGYNNSINSTFSTANPGAEFQTVFAQLYSNVKADPDWKSWHFTTQDNPLIDPTEIESAKKTLSSFAFKQEYLASFDNAGSDVFKEDWIKYGVEPDYGSYFIAIDLAGFEEVAKQAANAKKRLDESAIAVVKVTEDGKWFDFFK